MAFEKTTEVKVPLLKEEGESDVESDASTFVPKRSFFVRHFQAIVCHCTIALVYSAAITTVARVYASQIGHLTYSKLFISIVIN
jgi:hypothetical protein